MCEKRDISDVFDAMRLIINWQQAWETCLSRTSCKDCPYMGHKACKKKSTERVLKDVAEIFEYFFESGDFAYVISCLTEPE